MTESLKVLFTKKINYPIQSFDDLGIEYQSIDFIKILAKKPSDLDKKKIKNIKNHIITSKNAIYFVDELKPDGYFYCVGEKLSEQLKKKGFWVEHVAKNAEELCLIIGKLDINDWNYFCGNKRLNTIPDFLNLEGKRFNEIVCYETFLDSKMIRKQYDAFVFFSPSGVASFFLENTIPKSAKVYALGNSTAKKIEEYGLFCSFVPEYPDLNLIIEKINSCYAKK